MHSTDVFSEIYARAHVHGHVIGATNIGRIKALNFDEDGTYIHVVQQRPCRLRFNGERTGVMLLPGEVVTLVRARSHRLELADEHDTRTPLRDAEARVITARLDFDELHGEALRQGLPDILHVRCHTLLDGAPEPSSSWIPTTIAAMELEFRSPSVGSEIMLSKTAELLFVWTIRHYLSSDHGAKAGWAAALQDPVIHRALSMLHADPTYGWNVSELARLVGQSRSNFSQRFVDVVGDTPMHYLARWRMELAAQLLVSSNLHVSQIAERIGYASQAAFGRAFRRSYGISPTTYRDQRL